METIQISHWKHGLTSHDSVEKHQIMQEIVKFINNQEKKNEIYLQMINFDLSFFLCELLIYNHRKTTNLVIKVVCHLSEEPQFFKNDFFRCIRLCLRLINSSSNDVNEDEIVYQKNILKFNIVLLKRAQNLQVDFKDKRISHVSLILTASTLTSINSKVFEKLEFINTVLDILTTVAFQNDSKKYRNKKLIDILKNLKITKCDLQNDEYFMLLAKFIQTTESLLSSDVQTAEEHSIVDLLSVKFTTIIKFILKDTSNLEDIHFEIFLNLFYYLLKSDKLSTVRYVIINQFLSLNGMGMLIFLINQESSSVETKVIAFKSRIVLAEIMFIILKMFHRLNIDDDLACLRKKYLEIVFNCDFNPQNVQFGNIEQLSRETYHFVVFKYYIVLMYSTIHKTNGELLGSMAFIIEVFKTRKIPMDKAILSMMIYIYTMGHINIKIKNNNLLENSSSTLMRNLGIANVVANFDFLKWWHFYNWKNRDTYEKLVKFLISSKCNEDFMDLKKKELFPFDLKFLIQIFLDKNTPTEELEKLTRIICYFSLNLRDLGRILGFYEKEKGAGDRRIYALMILVNNGRKLNQRMKNRCCKTVNKTFEVSRNLQERLLAVQLLKNIAF